MPIQHLTVEVPGGSQAAHLYRLTGEGTRFAEELRATAADELPRAGRSGGVIRPARGEAC